MNSRSQIDWQTLLGFFMLVGSFASGVIVTATLFLLYFGGTH